MTDSDLDLLKDAAKAAGLPDTGQWTMDDFDVYGWNPLADDGDALRLAVELRIDVLFDGKDSPCAHVETVANLPGISEQPWAHEALGDDQNAATRRAIVRAAAKIGKAMP